MQPHFLSSGPLALSNHPLAPSVLSTTPLVLLEDYTALGQITLWVNSFL